MRLGKLVCLFLTFFMVFVSSPTQAQELLEPGDGVGTTAYKIGDAEIIAVRDNISERNRNLLLGDAKRIEELMPEDTGTGCVNVFAVKTKESIILIDAGWGAPKGEALENLKRNGITPDMVGSILITHLHVDHVSGLFSEGKVVFPNATVYVPAPERAYWFNDDEMAKSSNKAGFNIARQAILAYGDRVRTFEPGAKVLPGITSIDQRGHTPGHVGYLLETKSKKVLFWGDLTHFTEVQMAAPEIAVVYDIDPKQAVASRQTLLPWIARKNVIVAGAHIFYPGIGKIHAKDANSYLFEPLKKSK